MPLDMPLETTADHVPIAPARLWYGLAASAFAWALLGMLDIFITWRTCMGGTQYAEPGPHPGARIAYIVVALILLLVILSGGLTSYRNWRALSSQRRLLGAEATDRREFMALLGVIVSVTLGVGSLWLSLPPLVIQLCMRER